jgi:hypothetical protein
MSAGAWRTAVADAFDEQAAAIAVALEELDNVHAILEARGRDKACAELRALAARLRSEASAIVSEARALRAGPAQRDGFPLAITTRHPRPVAADEPKEFP